jgi:hypothetical protein
LDEKAEYCASALITRGTAGARLLVEPHGARWRLPSFTLTIADSRAIASVLPRAVAERFGLDTAVLSVLDARRAADDDHRLALVALDAFGVRRAISAHGLAWHSAAELNQVAFADEAEAERVSQWMAELAPGGGHPQRLPWTRPGWLAEATAWIENQLGANGLMAAGPVEQLRTWSLSVLLRVPLAGPGSGASRPVGDAAIFKALPPLFKDEPRITQALSGQFPNLVPEVIASDAARGWLLMRSFSGALLRDGPALAVWTEALRGYARMQVATIGQGEALLASGCADRRLAGLPAEFAAVLADRDHLLLGQANGLSAMQADELEALAQALPAACAALAACGLPDTLEHGDLHGDNIVQTPAGFIYFDWSDGCVAHPFTCLTTFLERVRGDWLAPLTDAYLEEWRALVPPGDLRRALRLSQPIGAAHLAVSYHRILAATEPGQRWQLAGALPFFLKEVLRLKTGMTA